jgi:hypothetical protein
MRTAIDQDEDYCVVGCDVIQFAREELRFRKQILPLSSGRRVGERLFKYYFVSPSLEEPVNQIQRIVILRYLILSTRLSSYNAAVPPKFHKPSSVAKKLQRLRRHKLKTCINC